MRALQAVVLALILGAAGPFAAVAAEPAKVTCLQGTGRVGARELIDRVMLPPTPAAISLAADISDDQLRTADSVVISLARPQDPSAIPWNTLTFVGAARGDRPGSYQYQPIQVKLLRREAGPSARDPAATVVQATMPESTGLNVLWQIVVAGCAADGTLHAYGVVDVNVSSRASSALIAVAMVLLTYLLVMLVSWKLHAVRLQEAWAKAALDRGIAQHDVAKAFDGIATLEAESPVGRRLFWKLLRVANPVFISQDGLGCGSLVRFQLLLFSLLIAGITLFIYIRAGFLTRYSDTVLLLLGITGGSAALSRLVGGSQALPPPLRRLLFGLPNNNLAADQKHVGVIGDVGFIKRNSSMPSLADLIRGEGEIEITRLQALVFTVIVAIAIVISGTTGLAGFALTQEIIYLLGISQGIYLLGRVVPTDTMRRLQEDLRALLDAARRWNDAPDGPRTEELLAYGAARDLASSTLREVYGQNFMQEAFEDLRPATALRAQPRSTVS